MAARARVFRLPPPAALRGGVRGVDPHRGDRGEDDHLRLRAVARRHQDRDRPLHHRLRQLPSERADAGHGDPAGDPRALRGPAVSVEVSLSSEESLDREALEALQGERLAELIARLQGRNAFYTRKLEAAGVRAGSLDFPRDLRKLPFTTKAGLGADQAANPPWGTALTEPLDRYTRYCQTSSTTGRPLKWIDTNESWQWLLECWKTVYRGARVGPGDRIFFPFS